MAYIINHYNGGKLTTINDGTIDNTTSLSLPGRNSIYGTAQVENFVYLTENFANVTPPAKPLIGQVWFDQSTNKLKFYDNNTNWRIAGGADTSATEPSYLTEGDLWYNVESKQLYVYSLTGSSSNTPGYVLVGTNPVGLASSFSSLSVIDSLGNSHDIIEAILDGNTIYTVSNDPAFTLNSTLNSISGFSTIQQGITLCNTADSGNLGVTTTNHRFWGTASNSDKLIVGSIGASASISIPTTSDKTSIVSRDATGKVYATIFNGAVNGAVGNITPNSGAFTALTATTSVSGAGFTTFLASPPDIGGTIPPNITGNHVVVSNSITMPTRPASDNSQYGANTEFVITQDEITLNNAKAYSTGDFSKHPNGYQVLHSGMIKQWGHGVTTTGSGEAISFNIPFPNACVNIQITEANATNWTVGGNMYPCVYGSTSPTLTGFNLWGVRISGSTSAAASGLSYYWEAVGY